MIASGYTFVFVGAELKKIVVYDSNFVLRSVAVYKTFPNARRRPDDKSGRFWFSSTDLETPPSITAVTLGRKGGNARKKALTPERMIEIARKAAKARWKNHVKKAKA